MPSISLQDFSFFLFPKDQECVPLSFYNIARMAKIDALIVNVRYCDRAVVRGNFFEMSLNFKFKFKVLGITRVFKSS